MWIVFRMNIFQKKTFSAFLLLFFCFLGVFFSTAQADTPPSGKLHNGAYTNWLRDALDVSSTQGADATNPKPTVKTELEERNVVKQARSLSDEYGKEIVYTEVGALGVGITNPTEIIDLRGKNASIRIKSSSIVARLLLSLGGVTAEELDGKFVSTLFVGDTLIKLIPQKFVSNKNIVVGGENVVLGLQDCPVNQKIMGTDSDGNIICEELETAALEDCNVNGYAPNSPHIPEKAMRPIDACALGEKDIPDCRFNHSVNRMDYCIPKASED